MVELAKTHIHPGDYGQLPDVVQSMKTDLEAVCAEHSLRASIKMVHSPLESAVATSGPPFDAFVVGCCHALIKKVALRYSLTLEIKHGEGCPGCRANRARASNSAHFRQRERDEYEVSCSVCQRGIAGGLEHKVNSTIFCDACLEIGL